VPPFDSVHRAELQSSIDYELFAVVEFRSRVHLHREHDVALVGHTLGKHTPDGQPTIDQTGTGISIGTGEASIRAALEPLRPLLFGAAFKAQDLIVEWTLRANGHASKGTHWPFKDKISLLRTVRTLPPEVQSLSAIWISFVETYARLSDARNVLVHRKGVRVHSNGDIELATAPTPTLLTHAMQGAFARVVALLGHSFGGTRPLNKTAVLRVESALAELAPVHGVTGLQQQSPRPSVLTINIPTALIRSSTPLECVVDFDEVLETWRRLESLYTQFVVLGEIRLQPEGTQRTWLFDPELLPSGSRVVLREGDPAFDSYLLP
jgi:hypothetical protein